MEREVKAGGGKPPSGAPWLIFILWRGSPLWKAAAHRREKGAEFMPPAAGSEGPSWGNSTELVFSYIVFLTRKFTNKNGVPWWCSRLRIQWCCCYGSGHSYGSGSIHGLGRAAGSGVASNVKREKIKIQKSRKSNTMSIPLSFTHKKLRLTSHISFKIFLFLKIADRVISFYSIFLCIYLVFLSSKFLI